MRAPLRPPETYPEVDRMHGTIGVQVAATLIWPETSSADLSLQLRVVTVPEPLTLASFIFPSNGP
jgi:hypothetical protein